MQLVKQLAVAFVVVVLGAVVESALMFYQAKTGKRLPFRISLTPRIEGDIK